ncbi:MAG TPA: putative FMN-dependent luciferase-like monooxygenase [Ensifer sp.]|jgi:putative FMN-dependent luciferase-like monooxygenase|uniref:putative FMN-dependent luciferase-like monooxygenase n=1 Tax=Ensifer sp. TaxID=1872086 RepID=UPI002E10B6BC|nr:putative FMN-dependent luciferase-like monooxygenase [Ensifer sp.]
MTETIPRKRLGFFTRLLDDVPPGTRYYYAKEQIVTAERFGFDTAWVAQHHFHADEGGLPAPLVFLAHVAAETTRIRLGTGVITLPLENPIRVAEDAAVFDLLSGGRLEVGFGTGGTPSSFTAFGLESADRGAVFGRHLQTVLDAWAGRGLAGGDRLYPTAPQLLNRIWQATFSVAGGERAGRAGDGLMLSRTQPRPDDKPNASLADLQNPIIDAYLHALPSARAPRILGSRSLFVADSRAEALRLAEVGLVRGAERLIAAGHRVNGTSLADLIAAFDVHVGTVDDVIESLSADETLERVTDLVFQVHSIDPPHPLILRSIELIATKVAPALGWAPQEKFHARRFGAVG